MTACCTNSLQFQGVREDVADIILNIKALCLKVSSEEPKTLRIECSGEQEVTAADILVDADVEILNPELHIATLDKMRTQYGDCHRQGAGLCSC